MSDEPKSAVEQGAIGETEAPKSQQEEERSAAVQDFNKKQDGGELSMHVKIHSPFREYYEGQAFSVSAENATGPFDILPKHHNFISLLTPCEVIVRTVTKGDQAIRISGGIMHVKADDLVIFLDV